MKSRREIVNETAEKILSDLTVVKDVERMEKLYTEYFDEMKNKHGKYYAVQCWFEVLKTACLKLEKNIYSEKICTVEVELAKIHHNLKFCY